MASSQLYPPLIDKSLPAFVVDDAGVGEIKIFFAPAIYNSINEIKQLQVTLRFRSNNANALTYGTSIYITNEWNTVDISEDPVLALSDYKYYITLSNEHLKDGKWSLYDTYKVQLRFGDEVAASNISQTSGISELQQYQDHYSEWSKVCLIRPIEEPTFAVVTLESDDNEATDVNESVNTFFTSIDADFIGSYTQPDSSEPLLNWRMTLYNDAETEILADTDWILFNSYDYMTTEEQGTVAFEGHLQYQMKDNTAYVLILYIETKNGYKSSKKYSFTTMANSGEPLNAQVTASINEDNAYAIVKILSNDGIRKYNNVTIRRTSSRSNFTIWEDVRTVTFANQPFNYEFHDFTIESGVFYQYGAQVRDIRGRRGKLETSAIVMGEFEDAFLVGQGQQLKLRYDFQISNSNINISESKTDTIGSRYPFVRRNGYMYYRTLQCSGLITEHMDKDADLFITDAELYNNSDALYKNITDQVNPLVNTYDYTKEREFRHAVMTFLYDNNVKLFKSAQEGNILVKLMSISLTPKQELGRLLYNFSATLVEIDEATLENCNRYFVQYIGNYSTDISAAEELVSQLEGGIRAYTNIVDIIKNQHSSTTEVINKIDFSNIKIEISDDAIPERIPTSSVTRMARYGRLLTAPPPSTDDIILGWKFVIQDAASDENMTIVVPYPKNSYELDARYMDITAITFVPTELGTESVDMLVKYVAKTYKESSVRVPLRYINQKVYGQLFGWFPRESDVVAEIRKKYFLQNGAYDIRVQGVYTLEVWGDEDTVLEIQTDTMAQPATVRINSTGLITFDSTSFNGNIVSLKVTSGRGLLVNYYVQVLKGVY